jgi:endonuclease-3
MATGRKIAGSNRSPQERERLQQKVKAIVDRLSVEFPNPRTALNFSNPLELLVATVLSAQCTDQRVNEVTASLFRKYKSARDYVSVPREVLEEEVRPTGYYRQKAKALQEICQALEERHGGTVPSDLEELMSLPGVGRKTANLIRSEAFGEPGIIVDTHVKRVAQRIGLTTESDPMKIEFDLMDFVPRELWSKLSNLLILHGRKTCSARRPLCCQCAIRELCEYPQKS